LSLNSALKALKSLGLTDMDARVYVCLAKRGPQEEKNLVYALNADELQLCCSLKNLIEKGFVTVTTENQTLFIAIPLEEVIDNLVKAKTKETQHLKQDKENFLSKKNQ
jgi:sugar-specific transcriptional regulator TrmB